MCNNARRGAPGTLKRRPPPSATLTCLLIYRLFPLPFFSLRDSSFPLSYFSLSLSLSLSLFLLLFLLHASQGYATVVLDHTWRAKLSLLTLGRDTKPEDRLGSSSKVDNNVTPNIPRGPHVTTSPRTFPRPGPSPGGPRGISRGRRSNGDAV
jgi:hypothetical protein